MYWRLPSEIVASKYNFDIKPYEFNTGLFDCCSDPKSCLLVCFCPVTEQLDPNRIQCGPLPDCDCWDKKGKCLKCDCYKTDSECCDAICSVSCFCNTMLMVMVSPVCPLYKPPCSARVRRNFVHKNFDSNAAKKYRGSNEDQYSELAHCCIGCWCPILSTAQIMREFIVRGGYDKRKKLSGCCDGNGKGMYDVFELYRMKMQKEEEKRKADEREETREAENAEKSDATEAERIFEEAKRRREENDRYQGALDRRNSGVVMEADQAFGSGN